MNNKSKKYQVFKNAGALAILQIVNYIVPLLLIPFLTLNLGLEGYGLIALSISIITFCGYITDYGFSLSATYEISLNIDNKDYISRKLGSIFTLKIPLIIISFIIIQLIPYIITSFKSIETLLTLCSIAIFFQAFQPLWFFQAIEKMKNIVIYSSITKISYALSVFLLVGTETSPLIVISLFGLSNALGSIIAIFFIYKLGYTIKKPNLNEVIYEARIGLNFFWSKLFVSLYLTLAPTIIGSVSISQAAIYSICEQLYKAGQGIFGTINTALFPYMAKNKDWRFFYKVFFYILFILILGYLALSPYIVTIVNSILKIDIINHDLEPILKILGFCIIINYIAVSFGYPAFSALGNVKPANTSVIIGGIFFACICVYMHINNVITAKNMALTILYTESLVAIYRFIFFQIKKCYI